MSDKKTPEKSPSSEKSKSLKQESAANKQQDAPATQNVSPVEGKQTSKESKEAGKPRDASAEKQNQAPQEQAGASAAEQDKGKTVNKAPSQYSGFDAVVREERKNRKLTFGPNTKKIAKPSNILIDIYGVISSWSFVRDLKNFARENMSAYLTKHFESKIVKATIARLKEQIVIDRAAGIEVPTIDDSSDKEAVVKSATASILWQMQHKHSTTKGNIERLCYDLWSQAYANGSLKTHVYDEVLDVFNYWRFEEFVKIYSYASGPAEGQRQFLKASILGDLNRFIANGLNASGGYKFDSDKFKSVASALRESKYENLLYITDCPKKARNAIQAGLRALVVNRGEKGTSSGKYSAKETEGLTVIEKLSDIELVDNPNPSMHCC